MDGKERSALKSLLQLAAAILTVAALVKELRTPKKRRTWHGRVAGFVPYDFRPPTFDRIRATYWNPKRPLVVGQVVGVGWTVNPGALKRLLGR